MIPAELPGAVLGDGIDSAVPAHYGSPAREQRALMGGRALVDLSHLELVTVTGPDRLSWVHSLTTQHISDLAPGTSTELILLTAEGRIQVPAAVYDDGETLYLLTDVGMGEELAEFLTKMRFMLRVEVTLRDDVAFLGGIGNIEVPRAFVTWRDPWPKVAGDSVAYGSPESEHPAAGRQRFIAFVPKAELSDAVDEWEGSMAGMLAWEAQRIVDLRPRPALDPDEKALPHEWDWLRSAVHLNKGCYRGQEAIARTVNLGRPPRRAVLLHLDGSEERLPPVGSEILMGEKVVGTLTSRGRDMDEGPVALGVLKRNTPTDAQLTVDGIPALAEVIVNTDGRTELSYERPKVRRI
ncbi:CAF17-like 4Fe-4S cluster assembly/insertion protein YgfZ [Flaviflexus massiliensis]|uniref:CAF17-like 4Fe-4S cluster assembly/insertion protein YgfZ n=1 Tax=Flaviflexus massiliensis TaxID=1522309 RepID=UPI0006D5A5B0|nr:folate-binding protein YgfZ [Flaviflexus massiliensis]